MGRIAFVGDPNQSLYGFRGANAQAFENIGKMLEKTDLGLTRHTLPKSWRNAQRIVQHCRKWVPDFDTYRKELGTVSSITFSDALERANNDGHDIALPDGIDGAMRDLPNCTFAFLCRINLPLIITAYQFIGMGKRVCVLGKSQIGEPLKRIIYNICNIKPKRNEKWRLGDKPEPASDEGMLDRLSDIRNDKQEVVAQGFLSRLTDWQHQQAQKFDAEGLDNKLERLEQDVQCLRVICDRAKADTAVAVLVEIDSLFSDEPDKNAIVFATIHKSKGLEFSCVFMLRPDLLPFPKATSPAEIHTEKCCCYVGYSRAKDRSYLVQDWPFDNKTAELTFDRPEEELDYAGADVSPQSLFGAIQANQFVDDLRGLKPPEEHGHDDFEDDGEAF